VFEDVLSNDDRFANGGMPKISLDTDVFDDLGVDSLGTLDLLNALEDEFDVSPNQYEANTKRTVREIVQYVGDLLAAKQLRKPCE
jgi:acyl carrier protein